MLTLSLCRFFCVVLASLLYQESIGTVVSVLCVCVGGVCVTALSLKCTSVYIDTANFHLRRSTCQMAFYLPPFLLQNPFHVK